MKNASVYIVKTNKKTQIVLKCIRYKKFTHTIYRSMRAISPALQNVFAFAETLLVSTKASVTAAREGDITKLIFIQNELESSLQRRRLRYILVDLMHNDVKQCNAARTCIVVVVVTHEFKMASYFPEAGNLNGSNSDMCSDVAGTLIGG